MTADDKCPHGARWSTCPHEHPPVGGRGVGVPGDRWVVEVYEAPSDRFLYRMGRFGSFRAADEASRRASALSTRSTRIIREPGEPDWTDPEVRAQLWTDSQVLQALIDGGFVDADLCATMQLDIR